jgi:hypothetical protein
VILCYLPTNNDDRVEEASSDDEDNEEHFLSSATSDRHGKKICKISSNMVSRHILVHLLMTHIFCV